MVGCHFKRWAVIGVAAILEMILCGTLALADGGQATRFTDRPFFQRPSTAVLDTGFFLSFSERYYQEVDKSLQDKSYFSFRYFLISPFESFDKRQYISENPAQAHGLAWGAFHKAIRQTMENVEVIEFIRNYVTAMTSLQMVVGAEGTRLHGPTLTGVRLKDSAPEADTNRGVALTGGLTFAEDLRLGATLAMAYQRIISKLSYYPTSGNEIGYTVEARLTSSASIGLSYRRSQDGDAVLTNLSFLF